MTAPSCAATPAERTLTGLLALVFGAMALSMASKSPILAVALGLNALVITGMTITGRCPNLWFQKSDACQIPAAKSNESNIERKADESPVRTPKEAVEP